MNLIRNIRIISCFGFDDSKSVDISAPQGPICVLGRNSSGKTSFLDAIASLAYGKVPSKSSRFTNFTTRNDYSPVVIADFVMPSNRFAEHPQRLKDYLSRSLPDAVKADSRVEKFTEELRGAYEKYYEALSLGDSILVHKKSSGQYLFMSDYTNASYKVANDHSQRIRDLVSATFRGGSIVINNSTYPIKIAAEDIENLLFLEFPRIVAFRGEFPLLDDLPERIDSEVLAKGRSNELTVALLDFLGQEDLVRFLNINDPDDRRDLLDSLQQRLDSLCAKINSFDSLVTRSAAVLGVMVHENNGLQLTFKVDGKKCFYRHLSETTKLLFAYHLYAEARSIDGAVLLFDEPNAGFHPSAQGFVLRFLQRLAEKNQVLFTTHSQHMIDLDRLASIRLMDSDKNGSLVVRQDFYRGTRSGDFLALQPIIDAIGLTFANQITLGRKVVITEGITDMFYLRSFKVILGAKFDLNIAPARGDSQISSLLSFVIGQGLEFKILIDTGGIADKIQEDFNLDPKFIWRVPATGDSQSSGIEDLFSKDDFRGVLQRAGIAINEAGLARVQNSKLPGYNKRIVAHKFYVDSAGLSASSFTEETIKNFQAALEFCGNSNWCVY